MKQSTLYQLSASALINGIVWAVGSVQFALKLLKV